MDEYIRQKIEKKDRMIEHGLDPYPSQAKEYTAIEKLISEFGETSREELSEKKQKFSIHGRLMTRRSLGKAGFYTIRDQDSQVQTYVKKANLDEAGQTALELMDIGDILRFTGWIGKSKVGELTLFSDEIEILSKSIQTLPEKHHGLTDKELRYRNRHLDLIANPHRIEIFKLRSSISNPSNFVETNVVKSSSSTFLSIFSFMTS